MKLLVWTVVLGGWVYAQVDDIYASPKERQKYRQEKQALRASTEDPRYDNYEEQFDGGCRSCDDDYIYTRRLRNFYGGGCAPLRDPFWYDPFWGPQWYGPWGPSWVYIPYRVGWSYTVWGTPGYYASWGDPFWGSYYYPWGPSMYYGTGYGPWGWNVPTGNVYRRNYAPRTRSTIQSNTTYTPRPNSSNVIHGSPSRRVAPSSPPPQRDFAPASPSPMRSTLPASVPRSVPRRP
ncbi:MAG: hypothetical protein ACUVRD_02235 [Bacteroidia bacterium]